MTVYPEMMQASLKMLAGLLIVLGMLMAVWYVARQFGRKNDGRYQGHRIQVLATNCIGIKKNISLVQVPGAILVLGITNDRISCLAKIPPEDWAADEPVKSPQPSLSSFLSHLKNEMVGLNRKSCVEGPSA